MYKKDQQGKSSTTQQQAIVITLPKKIKNKAAEIRAMSNALSATIRATIPASTLIVSQKTSVCLGNLRVNNSASNKINPQV